MFLGSMLGQEQYTEVYEVCRPFGDARELASVYLIVFDPPCLALFCFILFLFCFVLFCFLCYVGPKLCRYR